MMPDDIWRYNHTVLDLLREAEQIGYMKDSGETFYGGEPIDTVIRNLYMNAQGYCETVIDSNVDESSKTWFIIKLNHIDKRLSQCK